MFKSKQIIKIIYNIIDTHVFFTFIFILRCRDRHSMIIRPHCFLNYVYMSNNYDKEMIIDEMVRWDEKTSKELIHYITVRMVMAEPISIEYPHMELSDIENHLNNLLMTMKFFRYMKYIFSKQFRLKRIYYAHDAIDRFHYFISSRIGKEENPKKECPMIHMREKFPEMMELANIESCGIMGRRNWLRWSGLDSEDHFQ